MLFFICCFFQNQLFQKILSGIPSECQTDWNLIRPDILSGLIWVQSVYKGYEQTTKLSSTDEFNVQLCPNAISMQFTNLVKNCTIYMYSPFTRAITDCLCRDLNLCACWVIFHAFIFVWRHFSKSKFSKTFRNTIGVSNGLDPDQDLYFVGPDLDPNSLQRLLAKQGKS